MLTRIVLGLATLALVLAMARAPTAQAATNEEIEAAIDAGLAWLAAEQAPDGCWHGPYGRLAPTGLAVWKFEERARELGLNPFDPAYPYSPVVEAGLNCIFLNLMSAGLPTYEVGIDMIALAESSSPGRIVPPLGSPFDGLTYQQVLAGMLDWMEDGQNDGGCEIGGWGYGPNDVGWSDNSNTGYATMGIGFATHPLFGFGLTVGPNVLAKLDTFINNVQDPATGASHYSPCWLEGGFNILKQGNLIYEMALVGRPVDDPTVQAAVGYIEANWNWNAPACSGGGQGDYQATFTMSKGLQAYGDALDILPVVGDWFSQTSTYLVTHQNPDGSWGPGCGEGSIDPVLTTAWALLSLEPIPPPPRLRDIDIKPGSDPNSIDLGGRGVIPVAILTTEDFDATTVDPGTVCFGDAEDAAQRDCTEAHARGHIQDVDRDGDLDLLLHYETQQTGIDSGDTEACLTGATFGGLPITGCDSVRTVPPS